MQQRMTDRLGDEQATPGDRQATMRAGIRVSRVLAVAVLALAGLVAGCDGSGMGMGPMMGGRPGPTTFSSNGERIYFTGTSASGRPIALQGGDMRMQMHGGGCATCHGADRRGGARMMPRVWVVAPPITPEALFGDHEADGGGHAAHEEYDQASLARTITRGVDPTGRPLDSAMPRWTMDERDLADLLRYLGASGDRHGG